MALTEAMETDPVVMAELGGPVPRDAIPRMHQRRLDDPWWFVIEAEGEAAGEIGIWAAEHDGATIHETGWMLRREVHGRGIASAALAALLDRARAEPRFEQVHAFPGVTNLASNALCRKFGFVLRGEVDGEYRGAPLRCHHWVLDLAAGAGARTATT